jgi:N-acetylglucosamine-6-phosphate deacetylase
VSRGGAPAGAGGAPRGAPGAVLRGRIPGLPGLWELAVEGAVIRAATLGDPAPAAPIGTWITPGLFDAQVNGIQGVDFSSAEAGGEELARADAALAALGVSRYCPTLITASRQSTLERLAALRDAREAGAIPGAWGVHLEGPWISSEEGYRGVHSAAHARDPSVAELEAFQAAAGGAVRLLTLAPERPGSMAVIRAAAGIGITVALGHTNAPQAVIAEAVRAGARLSTHLFNGCPRAVDRHDNVIFSQLAEDGLAASFIADGHHVPWPALKTGLRAKGPDRCILVSDLMPLSGSADGDYRLAGHDVTLRDGRLSVRGTPMLAGAARTLDRDVAVLAGREEPGIEAALLMATRNPARLLGCASWAELLPGRAGPLAVFEWDGASLTLKERLGF